MVYYDHLYLEKYKSHSNSDTLGINAQTVLNPNSRPSVSQSLTLNYNEVLTAFTYGFNSTHKTEFLTLSLRGKSVLFRSY